MRPPAAIAPAAAAPASEAEVIELVRAAAAQRRPLAVMGRATKRHHGPLTTGTPVSVRRMEGITSYEPGDMVVTVQPGVRLADLQKTLAAHNQWLPLDPPYAEATMGGILATASAGPRRLGYGTPKDLVLGSRVVGLTGLVTKSGGRVVKNVTGYDLHKLHVGAFGTLAVLLEAHLKVMPRPEVSGAIVFSCPDFGTAHRLLLDVWGSPLRPVALEALDRRAVAALRALAPALPEAEALAIVGVEGTEPAFARHLRDLETHRGRARALTVLRGDAVQPLWGAFRDLPSERLGEVTVRVGARPHDLPALLESFAATPLPIAREAAAALGVARLHIAPPLEAEGLARAVRGWHERAAARGGYAVVEAAPVDLPRREALPFGSGANPLGRAIKSQWDPHELLNPGRMAL